MTLGIIFANTFDNIFAINDKLPWNCPSDMQYFKNLTLGTSIVMGRKTAESLSSSLPGRKNYILSKSNFSKEGFLPITIDKVITMSETEKVWIIGGSEIIDIFIKLYIDKISIISHTVIGTKLSNTEDEKSSKKNLLFYSIPELPENFTKEIYNLSKDVIINIYYRKGINNIPKLDEDYLSIGKKILKEPIRVSRNGEIRSSFDPDLFITTNFDNGFPILKSKQVWWKGIKEELLFFMSGKTDTKILEAKGIKIWSGNTSEKFIEENGKSSYLKPGDMGPMYGFQLRHFGAKYEGISDNIDKYDQKGIDQIEKVIDTIVNDPFSRRILMTTYNPSQADEGVLYPCHGLISQFYVDNQNKICIKTYQRSADWFLGVPFNLSSYALLLFIIVESVNEKLDYPKYSPGKITTYFGDSHLYECHIPIFLAQYVNSLISNLVESEVVLLDENLDLINYKPEKKFTAPMVS